jgi:Uncharacterized ABC-type transport system, permease components
MATASNAATDIVDRLRRRAGEEERISVGDVVAAIGDRGYGPLLFVPAAIELSPIGAVPGVPTLLALIIVLIAAQIAAGRRSIWLPDALNSRSVSSGSLRKSADRMRPVARWLDRWFHGRLERLLAAPFVRAGAAVAILLCLTVPPLELVPWASSAPMAAIAMFGLAMLARDGLLMAVAMVLVGLTGWFGLEWLASSGGEAQA